MARLYMQGLYKVLDMSEYGQYASIMSEYASISLKRGTHLTFNGIIVFILTFCLHKVLIKCRVSIRKSSI